MRASSRLLPKTIEGALDSPILSELAKEVGEDTILRALEYELMVLNELVGCTNRLSNVQIQAIAEQLLTTYPNESLADFKVCFMRATIGQYNSEKNKVVWLDGIVIGQWVSKYLDEKYQALEARLAREKDNPYEVVDRKPPPFNLVEEFEKIHGTAVQKVAPMTPEQIQEQGQKTPPRKPAISYRYTTPEEYAAREKELQASRKAYLDALRKKYPGLSDEQLNGMTL